uniref:Uncharacterized protein n=1 Tax=Anguilla anguilla TaxID=7936 RepID=A0A0E9SWR3_ANGAN
MGLFYYSSLWLMLSLKELQTPVSTKIFWSKIWYRPTQKALTWLQMDLSAG